MDNNKYKCSYVGCCQSFKWPLQQHFIKRCVSMKRGKNYQDIDGSFVCSKCSKLFNHQPNIVRYLKICKYKKPSIYKCTHCPKEFLFVS